MMREDPGFIPAEHMAEKQACLSRRRAKGRSGQTTSGLGQQVSYHGAHEGSVSNRKRREMRVHNLGTIAKEVFAAGVEAADPRRAVERSLAWTVDGRPQIAGEPLEPGSRLKVVAAGKAGVRMAEAVVGSLPLDLFAEAGFVVVDAAGFRQVDPFRVLVAGHPVPDAAGVSAAIAIREYLRGNREGDAVLVLLSGGASALLPAPAAGITLEDKVETTRRLLASGAPIQEINCVRKHLSTLKGGGMARLAAPARVESLILSDVVGDDLGTVASGPTAPDSTSFEDACGVLARHGLLAEVPGAVIERFEAGLRGEVEDTPIAGDPIFSRVLNRLVGSNAQSLEAGRARAQDLGFASYTASKALTGEARDAAAYLASVARREWRGQGSLAVLAGGETTVTLRGDGSGGRNQEMALAFALLAERSPLAGDWVFLSAGTDGRDGPTDAAGAVVDAGTLGRIRGAALDPEIELERNNSYPALRAADALFVTGPTGTNVADLQVLLLRA